MSHGVNNVFASVYLHVDECILDKGYSCSDGWVVWCVVEVLKQADIAEGLILQALGLIQALNPRGVGGNDYKAY